MNFTFKWNFGMIFTFCIVVDTLDLLHRSAAAFAAKAAQ